MAGQAINPLFLLAVMICTLLHKATAEISASSDLNCDFSQRCLWRNATQEDSGEWSLSSSMDIDANIRLIPMKEGDESPFAYTSGFMGRTVSMLLSDVISCHLGGASIKYWYYKTGPQATLEVCIRQPPGSREPTALRCYDGLSSTSGSQWIFRIIDLPPVSQPFEIVFRSYFYPPTDIIALDDILYEAALCGSASGTITRIKTEQNKLPTRRRRSKRAPPLIGYRDWQLLRDTDTFKGQTMIIVSQDVIPSVPEDKLFPTTPRTLLSTKQEDGGIYLTQARLRLNIKKPTSPLPQTTASASSSSTTTTTTTTSPTTTATTVNPWAWLTPPTTTSTSTSPTTSTSTSSSRSTSTSTAQSSTTVHDDNDMTTSSAPPTTTLATPPATMQNYENSIENFMKLFRQAAPVLPYIPVLVKTLQSVDPKIQMATGRGPLEELSALTKPAGIDLSNLESELRRAPAQSPVAASHIYHTEPQLVATTEESLVQLARKFGILDEDVAKTTFPPSAIANLNLAFTPPSETTTPRRNAFGLAATTMKSIMIAPTVYPQELIKVRHRNAEELLKNNEKDFPELKKLNKDELGQLAEIHKKIFGHDGPLPAREMLTDPPAMPEFLQSTAPPATTELVIYAKPSKTEKEVATKLTELVKYLPPDAMNDVSLLRNIPDLEGLTKGMDFSMIRKPDGFARLKSEFINRFTRRMMGLPVTDYSTDNGKMLPPPIVPVKVTRKMMAERAKKKARARAAKRRLR